ncbi:MAG: alpha/beta hydrolase [Gammaproteobacteria bacterium]|nr:alpha/beta hydrolase [Gammaproteobacteria bacterium]
MRRSIKLVALSISGLMLIVILGIYELGSTLSAPAPHNIGPPPEDLHAIEIEFSGIRGWFVPAGANSHCILLMHGVRGHRLDMIKRARFLHEAGYASLLFDFQAHGQSPGDHITFGYLESQNARAALVFVRAKFGCKHVGAIGQSLGGAAALLGKEPLRVDALVIESVYPTIEQAIADRLRIRLGNFGPPLEPLLTLQLKFHLGINADALRPIDAVRHASAPLFVLAGTEDQHTPLAEAQRLFDAAPEPKQFWAIAGAKHVDLYNVAPVEYQKRVLQFFALYVGAPVASIPVKQRDSYSRSRQLFDGD